MGVIPEELAWQKGRLRCSCCREEPVLTPRWNRFFDLLFVAVVTCMLSHFSHVQLFTTPWTVARQAPLSMGFSRQDYWSGLPCPPQGCLSNPRIQPESLMFLHWQAGSLPLAPP